ncbi:hypothetical protein DP107_09995 [Haloglomus irregulare]|uniref:Uncharacterized protein n=1 Tax=Haloglomus irregulare TaxID=2234134 RepID=A0A554N978_9EURY|nr:hypothetical protein [Haloglomus irregulare]TSD13968.1 hypothetical protein DP107_09995 [Haloglomus irregulare]
MSDASDRLLVEINRTGMRSLEVPDSVTVDRSFTVDLRNHGQDTHVHLHLDDALSEVARLGTDNHHVPGGSRRPVPVHVSRPDGYEPVSGRLKVAIAYGQETEYIDITVDVDEPVTVDPELSQPTGAAADGAGGGPAMAGPAGSGGPTDGGLGDRRELLRLLPAAVLGLVAVLLGGMALLPAGGPDIATGGFAVAAAVLAALYLLAT